MPPAAVLLALVTLALWSTLAVIGAQLTHVPPFLLVGLALCLSGLFSLAKFRQWRLPLMTFLVGLWGIFGYHFLLFSAFRYAPPVEANLINYLWPLLIVLLSPVFLPGYPLRAHHLIGALLGLSGAGLIVTGGRLGLEAAHLPGYLLAAGAAFAWSSYSLLTKRLPPFPTAAVGGFCFFSGLLALALYLLQALLTPRSLAPPLSALSGRDGVFLLLLGLGPMGAAFFTWDAALKRGDPRIIGALAYLTPLLSTFNLVVLGGQPFTWIAALALVLIVSGAVVGSLDLLRRPG